MFLTSCTRKFQFSVLLSSQLKNIFSLQPNQVQDINQALPINSGWRFELNLGLSAPRNTETSSVKHEEVVRPVTDSQCLGKRNFVLSSDRVK